MDISKHMLENEVKQPDFLKYFRLEPILTYRWDPVLLSSYLFVYRKNNRNNTDIYFFQHLGIQADARPRKPEEFIGKDKAFIGKVDLFDVSNQFDVIHMSDYWGFDVINPRLLEFCKKKQADAIYLSKETDDNEEIHGIVAEIADVYFRLGESLKNKYDTISLVRNPDLN